MLTISCPNCGAPVEFTHHASAAAVCEYCRTTVVRNDAAVADQGHLSAVLEDYSPIQIGTAGSYGNRDFTVLGRIQLRYESGIWNEWFLVFDDGATGWLGDASGQYVVTVARPPAADMPAFDAVQIGQDYRLGTGSFTAADKRTARCIGGEGELPFVVGDGWEARVIDLRRGSEFVTLDYSDGPAPQLYAGSARTLAQLGCQLLRDDDAIKASAGRYRGRPDTLQCPNCATTLHWVPGVTANLVCPGCRSVLDGATSTVAVLQKADQVAKHAFTLPLGRTGAIDGRQYRVLGAMVRSDEDGERWTEYLLYDTRAGFEWLIESSDGWARARTLDDWPGVGGNGAALGSVRYVQQAQYQARVDFAVGAFTWRVAAGDTCAVVEYKHGSASLASERMPDELTWSRSTRVAADQVRAWFGLKNEAMAKRSAATSNVLVHTRVDRFLYWLIGLNAIPLLFHFGGAAGWVAAGLAALVLPSYFLDDE